MTSAQIKAKVDAYFAAGDFTQEIHDHLGWTFEEYAAYVTHGETPYGD